MTLGQSWEDFVKQVGSLPRPRPSLVLETMSREVTVSCGDLKLVVPTWFLESHISELLKCTNGFKG